MESKRYWYYVVGVLLSFLIISLLYLPHLASLGIMTPWEMNRVSAALKLLDSDNSSWMTIQHIEGQGNIAPMPIWLTALGFKLFSVSEFGGRIFNIILFFLTLIVIFWSISHLISPRAAYFSTLIFAVFPGAGFHIMQIGGHGAAICFLAISFSALALFRWWEVPSETQQRKKPSALAVGRWLAFATAATGIAGGYFSTGGLIGILTPLLSVTLTQILTGDIDLFIPGRSKEFIKREGMVSVVISMALLLTTIIFLVVIFPVALSKKAEFNLLVGGTPRVGVIPTVDYYIEQVAFATYPWSALLPLGIATMLIPAILPAKGRGENLRSANKRQLTASCPRILFAIANFIGFFAVNYFAFRYANIPYVMLFPAAVACGVLLYDIENTATSWKVAGIIACLLLLLFFRDLHLYPDRMAEIWASLTLKEAYPVEVLPKRHFAIFTFIFLMMLFYVFLQGSGKVGYLNWFKIELEFAKMITGKYGWKLKIFAWSVVVLWVILIINAGVIAAGVPIAPFNIFTSIARKVSYSLALLPLLVIIIDFCYRLVFNALGSIKTHRIDLLASAGFLFGFWLFNGYLPLVARNLSVGSAIKFFKAQSKPGDELLTFRIGGEIGKFYGIKNIRKVSGQSSVVNEMVRVRQEKRKFLLYTREDNPSLNLYYREKEHAHLYVPEATSWRFLLAVDRPLRGFKQKNPIENIVRMVPPEPEYHVYANLDNKVEYLGYDLETKHEGDWAGALEHFIFRSYWHCTARIPGNYKFFIHIDGYGLRLNGDHEPLNGLYPTRYWRPGDYLIDTHEMLVPIHFRAGEYTIYIGLFQGERRLKQVAGPTSGDNRIEGGILRVR